MVAHRLSGHPVACPAWSLARRISYLCRLGCNPTAPLCHFCCGPQLCPVTSSILTALRRSAAQASPTLGILLDRITARSLRAGGAMALPCGKVETNLIKLVGRWRSDAMFLYLHAQTLPVIDDLASTMLQHGTFSLAPGATDPIEAAPILATVDNSTFP